MMTAAVSDVFFDLDHTLWDFEKNSALAFEVIFAELSIDVEMEKFLEAYVPINHHFWELYRHDKITHEELRYGRVRKSFEAIGMVVSDETIEAISAGYIRQLPTNNHLFDGAIEILDYLKNKYRLHIITNGFQEVQQLKLDNSGIGHYFETVTNSEMAGVKKPNPLIFEFALRSAKAKRATSVMIGDCIDADVHGALNCGLDAIHFCTNGSASEADIKKVTKLNELKKYL